MAFGSHWAKFGDSDLISCLWNWVWFWLACYPMFYGHSSFYRSLLIGPCWRNSDVKLNHPSRVDQWQTYNLMDRVTPIEFVSIYQKNSQIDTHIRQILSLPRIPENEGSLLVPPYAAMSWNRYPGSDWVPHVVHKTCHSVTFYFILFHFISWKISFSDISRECIWPNMIETKPP